MNIRKGFMMLCAAVMGTTSQAQNISEIANSDPLIVTGAIGTQNTFYHSAQGGVGAARWNNAMYANLNISVYGINMPFSFTYNNAGTGFSYPHFSFSISPTYKNWTLHLGRHTIPFSNYIYNMPTTGVGVEYSGKMLRFGAFYGQLRPSINDDPTDPAARNPQFSRYGWGLKAGIGNNSRYLDVYLFRATDRIGSVNEGWYDRITPQDNLVVGAKGRFNIKRFTLSANFASSIFTDDTNSQKADHQIVGDWDKIFDARLSTYYRFAGDVSASWGWKTFSVAAQYKLVQPDYRTMGSTYISNNVQSAGGNMSLTLFRGRVSLNANGSFQQDNITKKQLYTTSGYVYSGSLGLQIARGLQFTGSYNGYRQIQSDGRVQVNDTTRINRIMHSGTGALNYSFNALGMSHAVSVSHNIGRNEDLNPFSDGMTDVTTHATGVNYSLGATPIGMTFSMGYNRQESQNQYNNFTTDMYTFGTSRSFLKDNNLNFALQANLCKNKTAETSTNSFGASLSGSYTLKNVHQFTLCGSYNRYNNMNITELESLDGNSYSISLNYNYTFELFKMRK